MIRFLLKNVRSICISVCVCFMYVTYVVDGMNLFIYLYVYKQLAGKIFEHWGNAHTIYCVYSMALRVYVCVCVWVGLSFEVGIGR